MLREVTRSSHVYDVTCDKSPFSQWVFVCPDIHWDHPHCDRALLKKHLDEAVGMGARILLPGDTFCLMQGAYDPRKMKSDIRPEHNVNNYVDTVIGTAAEFFAPYRQNIDIVGLGNHETSILKRLETNVVERFVQMLNHDFAKGDHSPMLGGYGGWYSLLFNRNSARRSWTLNYFHGADGGSPVTLGSIEFNRRAVFTEGADCIVMGHNHQSVVASQMRQTLDNNFKPRQKEVLFVRCSTYKEEFGDGHGSWHVEKGRGPRPIGGQFICVTFDRGWTGSKSMGKKAKPTSVVAYARKAV